MKLSSKGYINELMNKKIKDFYVGLQKLGNKFVHDANEVLIGYKYFLPAKLGGGRFFFILWHFYTRK